MAGTGVGTTTGAGTYASGTVVSLTATPNGGSVFAGWSGNADCTDGSVTGEREQDLHRDLQHRSGAASEWAVSPHGRPDVHALRDTIALDPRRGPPFARRQQGHYVDVGLNPETSYISG